MVYSELENFVIVLLVVLMSLIMILNVLIVGMRMRD